MEISYLKCQNDICARHIYIESKPQNAIHCNVHNPTNILIRVNDLLLYIEHTVVYSSCLISLLLLCLYYKLI